MGLLKKLLTYGALVGTLGLAGCLKNRDDLARTKAIEKLPLEEIYLAPEVDLDNDGDLETIVIGKLKSNYRNSMGNLIGKNKCAIFLLDNLGGKYKIKKVSNSLNRYPMVMNGEVGEIKGHNYSLSLENLSRKKKGKILLRFKIDDVGYKKMLHGRR